MHRPRLVAAVSFSAALGSMHAFSVFLAPLEARLDSGRGRVSLIYAVGLVSLTLGVRAFGDWPESSRQSSALPAVVAAIAAAGLVMSALSSSYVVAFIGFAVVFGLANGVGYAAALEIGAATGGRRSGMGLALVTAAYAVGATVFSVLGNTAIQQSGIVQALLVMAALITLAGGGSSWILKRSPLDPLRGEESSQPLEAGQTFILWTAYGLAVIAGLMALGHAAEIVRLAGASNIGRQTGVALLTIENACGGVLIAIIIGRTNPWRLLVALPLVSAFALVLVAVEVSVGYTIAGLALVGATYGAIIALYPFAVFTIAGSRSYAATYGRVFTAWGIAGLGGPFLAGVLFDHSGSYRGALTLAAAAAVSSALVAARIRP